MANRSLPILALGLAQQSYSCHSCSGCCRDFTVQLRDDDIHKLDQQNWLQRTGQVPYVQFQGTTFLRQRDDGSCVFLLDDGRCRIHAEFGFTQKPIACQLFPFTLMPARSGAQVGLSFACPSVINSRGASLASHMPELRRMVKSIPEAGRIARRLILKDHLEVSGDDADCIVRTFEHWMLRDDLSIETRLDGAILLTHVLREEDLRPVLEAARLKRMLDQLVEVLPNEIQSTPATSPTRRHEKQLRQVVFAHIEDPKIPELTGRFAAVRRRALRQFWTNHQFSRGRGALPVRISGDWPVGLRMECVAEVGPAVDPEHVAWIDSLMTRYTCARLVGGRTFGPGYYGFDIVTGLEALWLMIAATGWLARLHAAGYNRSALEPRDVEAALIRTDRAAGRAPWLGSPSERLRLNYLARAQGIRRLRRRFRLTDGPADNAR